MNAIITGASKGIGAAIAEAFAARGYNLALCARNEENLQKFAVQLKSKYSNISILTMAIDVGLKADIDRFAVFVQENWKSVEILVNNAGIFIPGNVHDEPDGLLEKMIEINLYGAYNLTRKIVPGFIQNEKGYIFNICSVAALKAYNGGGSYSISKFALRGFTLALRDELKEKGIKVCGIYPGATWSSSWEGADVPEERMMDAEDIAKAICFQLDLSPKAVMEDIILRPQLGDL